ncbi:MAG: T9SS type A sorting domain-containing protein, partial [Edaphocola sp.]
TIPNGSTLTITGSGATATFSGSITIQPGGTLYIQNGATVKMAEGTKISVIGSVGGSNIPGAVLQIMGGTVTNATANTYWSGIEAPPNATTNGSPAQIYINNNSTISNATVALCNTGGNVANTNIGQSAVFQVLNSTLLNNVRHVSFNAANPFAAGITSPTIPWISQGCWFANVTFTNTTGFITANPVDMVYLVNCPGVEFYSCKFINNYYDNTANPNGTIGIKAINSAFRCGNGYEATPTGERPSFTGLQYAINVTNSLQTNRVCIVANTDFSCLHSINMSGCLNPYIINCQFIWPKYVPLQNYVGVYLNNCTGYKIEANQGYSHPSVGAPFAVLRNSGTAYNEIYRNAPEYNIIGIQAMGINRNAAASTGLKILCNDLSSAEFTGISIVKNPAILFGGAIQGVANSQAGYATMLAPFPIAFPASAGNWFEQRSDHTDFYVGSGINNLSQMSYRYSSLTPAEKPIYTNLLASNVLSISKTNTCPAHSEGTKPPPYPFGLVFVPRNNDLEAQIQAIEANGSSTGDAGDTTAITLDILYTQHAQLIDSIISYYQYAAYGDTTGQLASPYNDSIALVYQQVNVGYEYKIYLASAYADKGSYDDAIATINAIPGNYQLAPEEQTYLSNLADMFAVRQWLYQNEGNWDSIPQTFKDMVYQHEQEDPMFAGAMARALRAQYEDASYEPFYIVPENDSVETQSISMNLPATNKISPNPTTGHTRISWTGGSATLMLHNINGAKVWQQNIENGITDVNINRLAPGTYMAIVEIQGKKIYQQKIIKQ